MRDQPMFVTCSGKEMLVEILLFLVAVFSHVWSRENSESYLALEPCRNLIFEPPLVHSSPLRSHLLH